MPADAFVYNRAISLACKQKTELWVVYGFRNLS